VNISEYISSGILEAYAIGGLSDAERADVEKNMTQYPEIRAELSAIEEAQEMLLQKLAINPPASVKTKLMHSVGPRGKAVALNAFVQWKFVAAASIFLAMFLGFLAYDYRDRWLHTQVALNDLMAQNQQVAQDYQRVNVRLDKMENDLRIVNDPSFTKVVMRGTANAPQSLASVYWNKESKEVYLSIQSMRELTQEKQYQLWAIIDGKPVDAGVFDGNVSGLIHMKEIAQGAVTFAVTIEARGGTPSPTLETMQVAGVVSKG